MTILLTSLFNAVGDKVASYIPEHATVAFIPTAADVYDTKPWMEADRLKLQELGLAVEDYDIKNKTSELIYAELREKAVIFVSGGNSFYLLKHARASGFDTAVKKLVAEGKIYIGSSAGSILLGPTIEPVMALDNSEQAGTLDSYVGLGIVDFVVLPHYGKEKYAQRYEAIIREWSDKVSLKPLSDSQFIVVDQNGSHLVS